MALPGARPLKWTLATRPRVTIENIGSAIELLYRSNAATSGA